VLILSGRDDMLTPYEDAVTVASQFAHAAILRVPNTGHSVLTTAPGDAALCVQSALQRFFAAQTVTDCPDTPEDVPPTPVDPTRLSALAPTGAKGLAGRTTTAVLRTLDDSLLTLFSRGTLTGLRGGKMQGTTTQFTLNKVVFVPGVVVDGSVDWESGTAQLRVSGTGARGTLAVMRGVGVTGRLGGVKVHAGAAAARMGARLGALRTRAAAPLASFFAPRLDLLP
jgi:hypothetical protein